MKYAINSNAPEKILTDCLVIPVWEKSTLDDSAASVNTASGKALATIMGSGDVTGKAGDALLVHGIAGVKARRLLLVGCGPRKKFDARAYRKVVQASLKVLGGSSAASAHFLLSALPVTDRDHHWTVSRLVQEVAESQYQYDHTKSKKASAPALKSVSLSAAKGLPRKSLDQDIALGRAVGLGMNATKQLGNLPGNICTPSYLAAECIKLGTRYGKITTQVLSERQMQRLGMGSLLSVSAGSAQEATNPCR
ncbi:MAG: hypothetical protein RLZZ385_1775, partial [Pseudomonadota bacterium]